MSMQAIQPASCLPTAFVPCGGDVEGEWQLDTACLPPPGSPTSGPNPFEDCAASEYHVEWHEQRTGRITFGTDGGWSTQFGNAIQEIEILTAECLTTAGQACTPECVDDGTTCTCDRTVSESVGTGRDMSALGDCGGLSSSVTSATSVVDHTTFATTSYACVGAGSDFAPQRA